MTGWDGKGSTRRWRNLRVVILKRDGYRCRLQLPGICTGTAEHVHHLLGKEFGDDPAQLVSACQACNLKIGDPQRGRRRQRRPVFQQLTIYDRW